MKINSTKQFRSYVVSWFLLLVGLIILVASYAIYQGVKQHFTENFVKNSAIKVETIASLIDPSTHALLNTSSEKSRVYYQRLQQIFAAASENGDVFSLHYNSNQQRLVYAVHPKKNEGKTIFPLGSAFSSTDKVQEVLLSTVKNQQKTKQLKSPNQNILKTTDGYYVYSLIKSTQSNHLGLLVMKIEQQAIDSLNQQVWQSVLLYLSLLVVALMAAAIFFAKRITQPLEQLTQAIGRLIQNDFNFKLSTKKFGKLNFLAGQFNLMLHRIQSSRNELINLNKSYSRFIPHQLLKQLSNEGINSVSLGDCCERNMTILFCDIRGFTSLSEAMSPQKNFKFINHFFSQIAPVINKHGGIIDKYIGDGIMAIFPNSADEALKASIGMLNSLAEYNKHFIENKLPAIELGLGLHTGMTMLGTVGTVARMDATVISDTVNVASRVEAMTKAFATKILITNETKCALTSLSDYKIRYIANCQVPGKSKPVTLYEIFNNDPLSLQQEKLNNQAMMIQAWKIYKSGDQAKAIELYQKLSEKTPEDKSLFALIERCQSGRL